MAGHTTGGADEQYRAEQARVPENSRWRTDAAAYWISQLLAHGQDSAKTPGGLTILREEGVSPLVVAVWPGEDRAFRVPRLVIAGGVAAEGRIAPAYDLALHRQMTTAEESCIDNCMEWRLDPVATPTGVATERNVTWEPRELPLGPSQQTGRVVRGILGATARSLAQEAGPAQDPIVDEAAFALFTDFAASHNIDPAVVQRVTVAAAAQ